MKETNQNPFDKYLNHSQQGNKFHRMIKNMESLGFDFKKASEELNAVKQQEAEQLDEVVVQVEDTAEQLQEAFNTQNVSYTHQYIPTK